MIYKDGQAELCEFKMRTLHSVLVFGHSLY